MNRALQQKPGAGADPRLLRLGGTYNVRDVGGYPVAAGGVTRWRTLLRSDCLHRLDAEGRAVLAELGLRTIIDLRDEVEMRAEPNALDGIDARTVHRPVALHSVARRTASGWEGLAGLYLNLVAQRGDRLTAAIAVLCEPGAFPALVHCTAGKDRTGVTVALLLSAIGVADDVVAEDFRLSADCLTPDYAAEINERLRLVGRPPVDETRSRAADPSWIEAVLTMVREGYGGASPYLLAHGLPVERLEALRLALVEGA
jgi:protein-tyrosine phosphatase